MQLLSQVLLLVLAARPASPLTRIGGSHGPPAWAAAALLLGGCLWWVAQRQTGQAGATLAVAFYVSSPAALRPGPSIVPALGLFAMLYTAVGVAHAFQGPPRKRPPRIVLMTALTAFTASAAPVAGWVGLLLALPAVLYLAHGRRRVLLPWFAGWGAVGAVASELPLPGVGS